MRSKGRRITHFTGVVLVVLVLSTWAQAQSTTGTAQEESSRRYRGQGYVFIAPGTYIGNADSITTIHFGGGGEGLLYKGLGLGAEIGGITALQESSAGLWLFSANGSYHFARERKITPFLTGGYSSVGGNGQRNLINFGGGINYWFRERQGIRLEFRDHIYTDGTGRHLLGFRIGFAFR
jgi:hypothetical protein